MERHALAEVRNLVNAGGLPRACRAWPSAWPSPSGPLGWQRLQCSRVGACAHRLGDATGGSALDAGGASPDNARRSGPAPVTFHPATGAPGALRPVRLARGARDPRRVTAGRVLRPGAGHRRGGHRPATVRYRARRSGPGCPATCGESPQHPWPLWHGAARSSTLSGSARAFLARSARAGRPGAPKVRP
jgi:hypothetical protein